MKTSNILFILILLVLTAVGGWMFFKQNAESHKKLYTTEKPVTRDLTQIITASGNLKALVQITVGSLVAGKIDKLLAEDNDVVKKDQVLAMLDNGIGDTGIKRLQAALVEAEANYEYQQKFFQREQALYKSGQLSKNLFEQYKQNYEVTKSRVDQTKASLELEQKTYDNLFIKSPDDGIVIARQVNLGQMITAQLSATVLFEIAKDLHCMEANIDVDEADIGLVKEKQDCLFSVDAFPKEQFCAKVKRIQYQAKIVDGVVTYATVLDVSNPDLRLRPGMTVNVEITVASAEKALCVPNKAFRVNDTHIKDLEKIGYTIKAIEDGIKQSKGKQIKTSDHLWVVEGSKTIKQVIVQLGVSDSKFTQITSGLDANAEIIIDVEAEMNANLLMKAFKNPGSIGK